MSGKIFPQGLEGFADGSLDWDTDTFKAVLFAPASDTAVKIITAATNASPSVLTSTSHGLTINDKVVIGGVGGNGSVNGVFRVNTVPDGNTFTLKTFEDGLVVAGSGAYTSGGWLLNLTTAKFRSDVDAAQVGTAVTLTSKTKVEGLLDAADVAFTGISGTVAGALIYKDNASAAADRLAIFHDGRTQVEVAADAATSATTIWVKKLLNDIPTGTVLSFSNGVNATLTSQANAGAHSLAVSALSAGIVAGHQADAPTLNNNLPFTYAGGGGVAVNITWDAYIAAL